MDRPPRGRHAGYPAPRNDEPKKDLRPFPVRDPDKPTEEELAVFAKRFCADLRKLHGNTDADALRSDFDPRYLKKYDLADRKLSVRTAALEPIYNVTVADDLKTVLCVVGTKENASDKEFVKEASLLQTTVHEGKLYLVPAKAPEAKTGTFTPWILRTKL